MNLNEMANEDMLHIKTPLIHSKHMSLLLNHDVYLKMETAQISGSFKIRGIGYCSSQAVKKGSKELIGCSGGNAGIAVSHSAKLLNVPCSVYVPETTSKRSIELMKAQGANVIVKGENFSQAEKEAIKESEITGNTLIHAYDHPYIWKGNSSIIHEIHEQLEIKPSLIISSVGGGGLLCGILEGMEEIGWSSVPVLAMETQGAHCFNLTVKANKIVPLEKITSIATTLGARTIPQHLFDILSKFKVASSTVSDAQAVYSCLKFADHEGKIVEPSCGASLAAIYCNILQELVLTQQLSLTDGPVVVIVSGGSSVTLDILHKWAKEFDVSECVRNA